MIKVDNYIEKHDRWKQELLLLRQLMLESGMKETVKWGFPVYTIAGKNVAGIGAFKEYVGIWFFQGALLQDREKVLVNAQEGKTKAMRQWRFVDMSQINQDKVKEYLSEAVENQKAGKKVPVGRGAKKPLIIPPILGAALKKDRQLANQFGDLTLSKRREFADYIQDAKRESTKQSRLEKALLLIRSGRGLYEKYQ